MMSSSDPTPFSAEVEALVSEPNTTATRRRNSEVPGLDQSFWEQRWQSVEGAGKPESVDPNRTLTEVAALLPPGNALDAGCGQGGDAIWLAKHGWEVTAVDFVSSALRRGRWMAEQSGDSVANRIVWHQADLNDWEPERQSFDLVSAHYLHGVARRADMFARLAAAVRPRGTLLVVGHHPSSADISGGTMPNAVFFTSADVTAVLGKQWDVIRTDDDTPRDVVTKDGKTIRLRSSLTQARRR
ncbi:class I SAM-dependent methyltransferase [Mycolicibacterium iranicum]|nr:class I SAM-dependent methyltransferase [Mycolicibacterium iranicum]